MRSKPFSPQHQLGAPPRFAPARRSVSPFELRAGDWVRLGSSMPRPLQIVRKLGRGSHSIAYVARSATRHVTLIVSHHSEQTERAFLLQRAAHHAHVLPVVAQEQQGAASLVVSQFAEGGALDTLLLAARRQRIVLPLSWRLSWFLQLVAAVASCHQRGIVHYDITPQNLLLVGASQAHMLARAAAAVPGASPLPPAALKLADFGLASRAAVRDGRGTISSLPPEALWGIASGAAQDTFALGCTLFALVLGTEPFDAADEQTAMRALLENNPSVTPDDLRVALRIDGATKEQAQGLASLAAALTARDPQQRPRAAAAHVVLAELFG